MCRGSVQVRQRKALSLGSFKPLCGLADAVTQGRAGDFAQPCAERTVVHTVRERQCLVSMGYAQEARHGFDLSDELLDGCYVATEAEEFGSRGIHSGGVDEDPRHIWRELESEDTAVVNVEILAPNRCEDRCRWL